MKKKQIVLYVIVLLTLLTTSVFATIKAELGFKITADDNKFYPGEEFVITIGLKGLETDKGIKSIEGYIDIDENVLEPLTTESIVKDNDGKVQIGTDNLLDVYDASEISSSTEKGVIFNTNPVSERGDYKIVINLENPISADTDLVNVKFKIKNSISAGDYSKVMTYQLFKVFSIDAGEKLELPEVSYAITISDPTVIENEIDNTLDNEIDNVANESEELVNNVPSNKIVENTVDNTPSGTSNNSIKPVNNTSNNVVNNKSNNVNNIVNKSNKEGGNTSGNISGNKSAGKDNTVAPTNLPKTGLRLMLIPIIAVAIVGLVFYKKYSKYNNFHE